MDLSQRTRSILSFVNTVDAGSFTAAARKLGVSNATVSKNVAGLEQALGVRLLNRTTRKLSLTKEGAAFLQQARLALDSQDSSADAIGQDKNAISGKLRMLSTVAFGREHLLPALSDLLASHPQLAIDIDFDDRVVDVAEGGYDIVIRGSHIEDASLIARPICHLQMVLVASPAYLAQAGVPQTLAELVSHHLITRRFSAGKVCPWMFRERDDEILTLDIAHSSLTLSSPELMTEAAVRHMGITQVAVQHAWPYLERGKLKVLLLGKHDPGPCQLVMQFPHRALISPRIKACIDHLSSRFSDIHAQNVAMDVLEQYSA